MMEWQKLTPEALEMLKKEECFLAYLKSDENGCRYCVIEKQIPRISSEFYSKIDYTEECFMLMREGYFSFTSNDFLKYFSHYCLIEEPK